MYDVVNGNIAVEQTPVRVIIMILAIEEEAAATLWIKIPKKNAEAAFGEEAGQVYGCCGFSNASLDIVYGDLFQKYWNLFRS
jgi:hypothetical protein